MNLLAVADFVFPGVLALVNERKINAEVALHHGSLGAGASPAVDLPEEVAESLYGASIERKEALESKARSCLGVSALAFSVSLAVVRSLVATAKEAAELPRVVLPLTIYGLWALILAALAAYTVLKIRPWCMRTLGGEETARQAGSNRRDILVWYIKINELQCSLLGNFLDAATRWIRNGIAALGATATTLLVCL